MTERKLRGYVGEQSFELSDGWEAVERFCESQVFGSAYRAEREVGSSPFEARSAAMEAVSAFRRNRQ